MRVMVVACPMLSHAYPMVPLAWALRAHGDEVLFVTGGTALDIAGAGFAVLDSAPGFVLGEWAATRPDAPPGVVPDPHCEPMAQLNLVIADKVLTGARSWQPDLVLYDPLAPVAALAAAELGIPAVRHNNTIADVEDLLGELPGMVAERLGRAVPPLGPRITFAPESLEYACHGDWSVRAVAFNGGQVLPDWLWTEPERRTVVVTTGSIAMPGEQSPVRSLVTAAADVAADFLLLPGAADGIEPEDLPDNVRSTGWTALSALLPRCHAVVHHGGAATMIGALSCGLPQLVLPNGVDRVRNADIIHRRGAGLRADPDTVGTEVVTRLVDDPGLREAAEDVRTEIAAMPPPTGLVPRLHALVG